MSGHSGDFKSEFVDRAFQEIERELVKDREFVRRVRRQLRAERAHLAVMALLLTATALLLALGLATYTWTALVAGGAAFAIASVLDCRWVASVGNAESIARQLG